MICELEWLGGSPPPLYALALKSEASQSKVVILIQTLFNTIKHFVIVCLIPWAPEQESTGSPQPTSPASFPVNPRPPLPHQSATPDTEDFSTFPNPPRAFPPRTLHPTPHFCLGPVCFTIHFKLYLFTHLVLADNCVLPHWLQQQRKSKDRSWFNNLSQRTQRAVLPRSQAKAVRISPVTLLHPPPSKTFSKVCPRDKSHDVISYFVSRNQQAPLIDTRAEMKKELQDSLPRRLYLKQDVPVTGGNEKACYRESTELLGMPFGTSHKIWKGIWKVLLRFLTAKIWGYKGIQLLEKVELVQSFLLKLQGVKVYLASPVLIEPGVFWNYLGDCLKCTYFYLLQSFYFL